MTASTLIIKIYTRIRNLTFCRLLVQVT